MTFRTISRWARGVPHALVRLREDVDAVLENDPAARDRWDALVVAPGLHALWLHRAAHDLWTHGHERTARLVAFGSRFLTGVEIHPAARIGRRVVIDHGMGVVIGETASIGNDCILYKGVVLGARTRERVKRHPDLDEGVIVGSNACILGDIRIGAHSRIGSGSVVIAPVPPAVTVAGVPARPVPSESTRRNGVVRVTLPSEPLPKAG